MWYFSGTLIGSNINFPSILVEMQLLLHTSGNEKGGGWGFTQYMYV